MVEVWGHLCDDDHLPIVRSKDEDGIFLMLDARPEMIFVRWSASEQIANTHRTDVIHYLPLAVVSVRFGLRRVRDYDRSERLTAVADVVFVVTRGTSVLTGFVLRGHYPLPCLKLVASFDYDLWGFVLPSATSASTKKPTTPTTYKLKAVVSNLEATL